MAETLANLLWHQIQEIWFAIKSCLAQSAAKMRDSPDQHFPRQVLLREALPRILSFDA